MVIVPSALLRVAQNCMCCLQQLEFDRVELALVGVFIWVDCECLFAEGPSNLVFGRCLFDADDLVVAPHGCFRSSHVGTAGELSSKSIRGVRRWGGVGVCVSVYLSGLRVLALDYGLVHQTFAY
eukprot:m.62010 g.62010  ORF g.62010 m.62010 type:complete len:124 (-) comp49514_c0_seq4:13-384(-)